MIHLFKYSYTYIIEDSLMLLFVLGLFSLITSVSAQYMSLNDKKQINLSMQNQFAYTAYVKTSELSGNKDKYLIIEVQSEKRELYAGLLISINKIGSQQAIVCSGLINLPCVIKQQYFGDTDKIKISVKSDKEGFHLLQIYQGEFQVLKKQNTTFTLDNQIAKYFILPIDMETMPKSIRVTLKPSNQFSYCHMTGKTALDKNEGFQSINMWSGTEELFLSAKQIAGSKLIYLIVIGQLDEQFALTYQIVTKDHYDISVPQQINQYLSKNQQRSYHIKFTNLEQKEELIINFMIYAGNPEIIFYLDSRMTKVFKTKYFQYMADSRFVFDALEMKGISELYFKIISNSHNSVFKLEAKRNHAEKAEMLIQNSYNFYSVPNDSPKFLYLYLNLDENSQDYESPSLINVTISLMHVLGSSNLMFYWGNTLYLDCLPGCLSNNFETVKQITISAIALKSVYKLSKQNKNLDRSSILLIKLWSKNPQKIMEQVSIEYNLDAKVINLRENYPLTEIVEMGEKKIYRYTQLEDYKNIKICASVISGDIGVLGSEFQPSDASPAPRTPVHNCIQFNNAGRKKVMYVTVFGVSKSKYSISIQAGHYSEIVSTPAVETNEDIDYEFTINPLGTYVFLLHPLYSHLRLNYNSSHPMKICLLKAVSTNDKNPQLGKQNSQGCDPAFKRQSEVSGQFYYKLNQNSEIKKLEVTNPSLNQKLLFRMKYHSGNYAHCEQKLTNKIYEQDIGSNTCFQFQLQKIDGKQKNYQIITKQLQISPQTLTIGICGKQTLKIRSQKVTEIKESQIRSKCDNSSEPTIEIIMEVNGKLEVTFKIQYIVQILSGIVRMPLDVQFIDYSVVSEAGPLRQYAVDPSLQKNIVVFIKEHSSKILFTIKVYVADKLNYITQSTYKQMDPIIVNNMRDDLELTVVILATDIRTSCQSISGEKWMQCDLIVVIQPLIRIHLGNSVQYTIQFKSTQKQLKPYQPQTSLINYKDESDVYSYYPNLQQPTKEKYMAGILISTHNQPCFQLYVNRFHDVEFDKKSTSLVNSTAGFNIFPIDSNVYYVQVTAKTPNCRYTIQVSMIKSNDIGSNGKYKVNVLHPNQGFDIRITPGQLFYFVVEGAANKNWRILYLRKFGSIRMHAVEYNSTTQAKILKNQSYKFSIEDFSISQEVGNNLRLDNSKEGLYIVVVEAQLQSQGTLILHNSQVPIVIPNSKNLMYTLDIFESVHIKFYTPNSKLRKGKLRINLIFGKINVNASLVASDEFKKQSYHLIQNNSKCCELGSNEIPFQFSSAPQIQYLRVKIDHKPDWKDISIFEVSIQLQNIEVSSADIDKDALNELSISKMYKTVVKTSSIYPDYKIIISAGEDSAKLFREATFNKSEPNTKDQIATQNKSESQIQKITNLLECLDVKISNNNNGQFKITKMYTVVNNVLYVEVSRKLNILLSFQNVDLFLDMTLKDNCPIENMTVSLTPDLGDKLSLLNPFKWVYLSKQRNFAIASKEQFLIDVVSCSGPVQLTVAKSYKQLYKEIQSYEKTSMLSHQPHVFKIIPTQTVTYFKLKSEQAIIRYIKPNFQTEAGTGYFTYDWDYFLYETDFQKLTIILKPLKNVTSTNTTIVDTVYFIKILSDLDTRHSSVQCVDVGSKTAYFDVITSFTNEEQRILISKQTLLQSLNGKPQNLYISIDLAASIRNSIDEVETYKFLAPAQEIPLDIFNMTRLSNKIIGFGIFIILAAIFGCGLLAQFFLVYIVPMIGRLKRSNQLVQQQNNAGSQQLENVPASSDRNQRVSTNLEEQKASDNQNKLESQQKMQA